MNGFSTECVLMCLLRLPESENDLKHYLQVNGFSPEWVLQWVLRFPDENYLWHSLQVYGFSPEWVLMWVLSSDDWENDLEHSLQMASLLNCFWGVS